MGRGRAGRHATRAESWTRAVAGLPWITLVLLGALLAGGVGLLQDEQYAAEATLSAPDAEQAARAAERLADPALVGTVEEEVQLTDGLRGALRLTTPGGEGSGVVLRATAPDPRLAAVAADTAVALVAREQGEGFDLATPAAVPTEPVEGRSLAWVWLGLPALAGALWVEGAHRVWLRRHPAEVAEGAR